MNAVTYGLGGYDPTKPNNNIVSIEQIEVEPQPPSAVDAAATVARLTATPMILAAELDDDTVAQLAPLFDPWRPDETVETGDLRSWDGTVVECIQAHTTQADWTPGVTPALWKIHRTTEGDEPDEWVQPLGGHDSHQMGDRVTHKGKVWESTAANNVWEPGVYGWVVV